MTESTIARSVSVANHEVVQWYESCGREGSQSHLQDEKKGMTSAIMNEAIQVSRRTPDHQAQPLIVCSVTCLVFLNMRKKMKRDETEA